MARSLREEIGERIGNTPNLLRAQIPEDLHVGHRRSEGRLTSREANDTLWRNYRFKIRQAASLFGATSMGSVVDICLAMDPALIQKIVRGTTPATGALALA